MQQSLTAQPGNTVFSAALADVLWGKNFSSNPHQNHPSQGLYSIAGVTIDIPFILTGYQKPIALWIKIMVLLTSGKGLPSGGRHCSRVCCSSSTFTPTGSLSNRLFRTEKQQQNHNTLSIASSNLNAPNKQRKRNINKHCMSMKLSR